MDIIFKTKFGSHLYGLATKDSDTDYKGIFLPSLNELLLGTYPKSILTTTGNNKSKNTKDDIDEEYYSLPYFIKLACEGDTTAIDMLHATKDSTLISSSIWEQLKSRRTEFYSSDMKSLVGYARHQAAKYGMKGTRLAEMRNVIKIIENLSGRLVEHESALPINEFCFLKKENLENKQQPYYSVCGKKYLLSINTQELYNNLTKQLDQYGERALLAEKNEGVDWKAISHAFRAAEQMQLIYSKGDFEYPLPSSAHIKAIKLGLVDFLSIKESLENLLDEVEHLSKVSSMRKKVNIDIWNNWLLDVYYDELI